MAPLTPQQLRRRDQVESLIRLMAPALDLLLAAGDRLSRIVSTEDTEYPAVRMPPSETTRRTDQAAG